MNKVKKVALFVILIFQLLIPHAFAEEYNGIYDAIPKNIISQVDNELLLSQSPDELLSSFSFNKIISFLNGIVKKYLPAFSEMLLKILAYILFFSVLRYFSFKTNGYSFVISCLANAILLMELYSHFSNVAAVCSENLKTMCVFANACIPSITALLIAGGKSFQSALFCYSIGLSGNLINILSVNVFLPLMHIFLALGSCGSIWEDIHFGEITDLISKFIKWLLGIVFSLFTFTVSIQNLLSKASDTVAQKAVKTAAGSIPVVGGMISDGVDGAFALISGTKTTTAVIGIITILSIFSGPAILMILEGAVIMLSCATASFFGQKDCLSILKIFKQAYILLFGLFSVCILMCIICFLLLCFGAN